ncbi:O-antigen ligase family protein [Porphyromonas levii]|uniref:O-antigen ligase family protein n=1 Tax=Porphyromonas levii TaxID=28114 RepID=UPI001BA993B4|nr:O-antigen ligase family protein [Porphyromonas levii]
MKPSATSNKYFSEFISIGVISLLSVQGELSLRKILNGVVLIGLLCLPTCMRLISTNFEEANYGGLMGLSYGMIRFFSAALILFFLRGNKKYIQVFLLLYLSTYLYLFFNFASRGAILSILILAFILAFIKHQKHRSFLVLAGVLAILLVSNFYPILYFLSDFFHSMDISIFFIDKLLKLNEMQNIDNGRFDIINRGIKLAMESPIYGQGIAAFENKYMSGWVHNFFVELFIEGGLLLLLPFVFIVLKSLRLIFIQDINPNEKLLLALFFCCGLIELLFSNYLWRSPLFWQMIGYTLYLSRRNAKRVPSKYRKNYTIATSLNHSIS